MNKIIPVVSGKGGVGKSTVAVNLALSLVKAGKQVALIDSDFYGPSIPTLLGTQPLKLDHENRIIPPVRDGLKYMSIGFFLEHPDDPVIWRGPMFNKALDQLFNDVNWGQVDYFIVDMPPGTGDAQISLAQNFQLAGAVVVTTPQEVALTDVRKAINMLGKVNVQVLGIVENMSGFTAPNGEQVDIFGKGGGERLAAKIGVPLLAKIPIDVSIREGGDLAEPVALSEAPVSKVFDDLAMSLIGRVDSVQTSRLEIIN